MGVKIGTRRDMRQLMATYRMFDDALVERGEILLRRVAALQPPTADDGAENQP